MGGGELLQGVNGLVGPQLLHSANHRVDSDNGQNNDGVQVLPVPLHTGSPERDRCRGQQNKHHKVFELAEEAAQQALAAGGPKLVFAVFCQAAGGLGRGEAPLCIRAQGFRGLLAADVVKLHG